MNNIHDLSDLRKYRTELPNLIDDLGLSVYAYRLYGRIKRVAGARGGSCWQSTRTLATACNMSVGKISSSKQELVAAGLITITPSGSGDKLTDEIYIVDIWTENMLKYGRSQDEHDVHHMNAACSPGETKNKPSIKKKDSCPTDKPAEKSAYVLAMEELEGIFANVRNCPLPDWKNAKAANRLWRTPLKGIWKACNQDTAMAGRVVADTIRGMLRDELTVVTPASIEKVALSTVYNIKQSVTQRDGAGMYV